MNIKNFSRMDLPKNIELKILFIMKNMMILEIQLKEKKDWKNGTENGN